MMMIAFKGAGGDFLKISSLRRELSPTCTLKWPRRYCVQITCNTLSAYHVQRVMCHFVRRDSSAIKFYRVEIAGTAVRLQRLSWPFLPKPQQLTAASCLCCPRNVFTGGVLVSRVRIKHTVYTNVIGQLLI